MRVRHGGKGGVGFVTQSRVAQVLTPSAGESLGVAPGRITLSLYCSREVGGETPLQDID